MVLRTVEEMTPNLDGEEKRGPLTRLRLPVELRDVVIDAMARSLPNEGCGLLAGSIAADGVVEAARWFLGENVDASPTRFTMDGAQVVAAFREMRESGLELAAIVHSHPSSPPRPSPTDIRESRYPDALALIVSFETALPEIRAWRWLAEGGAERYRECPIDLIGDV
ncbi:MAG: Mov34/MPN/PAD-1 family protein [Thermomicrobiales bacterium]|jgi:proteasome lid subunit RPN8/RPN11|nr:Mov34/MPN/PAD-1 family protein [Thermomicrobiales bacterium]